MANAKSSPEGKRYVRLVEYALDTCSITIRPKLEIKYKILSAFKKKGDSNATAICRALEFVAKDLRLSADDLRAIDAEMKRNYEKRMENRRKQQRLQYKSSHTDYSRFSK